MTSATAQSGPAPTRDLDRALADLDSHGACIVTDVVDGDMLAEVHTALYRAAESDRRYGLAQEYVYGGDDHVNQRIWNLPSHDPVFCALAEHPVALHFVRALLGWPAILSSMSANITALGGQSMILHCDQGYLPWAYERPHVVNIGWCVDDFAVENGATLYIPGSHRWNGRGQGELDAYRDQLVPLEAPAGSVIVMEGRLMHTNGINTNGVRRAGVFASYSLPVYMPQENWFLSLNPAVRQTGSETLMTLLGFRPGVLGRINGLDRI